MRGARNLARPTLALCVNRWPAAGGSEFAGSLAFRSGSRYPRKGLAASSCPRERAECSGAACTSVSQKPNLPSIELAEAALPSRGSPSNCSVVRSSE